MLYTFSQSHYEKSEVDRLLSQFTANDALLFWQNGVNFFVKNKAEFEHFPQTYVLEMDLIGRGLEDFVEKNKQISLQRFVELTQQFYPQIAL